MSIEVTGAPLEGSNYLVDIAARIKAEHKAAKDSLQESVRHAIEAGTLLLEAKEQLKHGQWLPWLKDHCTISERTAQLCMRCAKGREEIEKQMRNGIADLTLTEAAAMLALSSDIQKLIKFFQDPKTQHLAQLDAEGYIKAAAEQGIAVAGVIQDVGYNPMFGCSDEESQRWHAFALWLTKKCGWHPTGAWSHVEWLRDKTFQTPDEAMEDKERIRLWMKPLPEATKQSWLDFIAGEHRSPDEINQELQEIYLKVGADWTSAVTSKSRKTEQKAVA
jgi:hypothetical protein